MGVATDIRKLKGNLIRLPYGVREEGRILAHKWEAHRRLSQLEQLRVDQLLAMLPNTEKTHGRSDQGIERAVDTDGESDNRGRL